MRISTYLFKGYRVVFTIGTSILAAAATDANSMRVFNERARGRAKLHIPRDNSESPGNRLVDLEIKDTAYRFKGVLEAVLRE